VTENCGAIPDALLESVLFGHLKGAFTGADRSRPGLFEMANRGTLFLDEIDSMSLPMQTKLLRTLQDGVIRPLGGEIARRVDVRVLAATGTRLDRLVGEGKFREDLYYRINVISLELPPLRERKEDVPLLVSHFIGKHSGGRKIEVSRGAMKKLMDYDWPGNVRQLENEIMRAIVLSEGRIMEDVLLQDVPAGPEGNIDVSGSLDLNENVEKVEKVLIGAALVRTGGNQSAAARMLGVSRFGLIKKMARYGIAKP
jgi:serine/threonine-protein kinase PknK